MRCFGISCNSKNYCHIFHALQFSHVHLSYTYTQNFVKNVVIPLLWSNKMKLSYDTAYIPIQYIIFLKEKHHLEFKFFKMYQGNVGCFCCCCFVSTSIISVVAVAIML
jgi:hypothetical protein